MRSVDADGDRRPASDRLTLDMRLTGATVRDEVSLVARSPLAGPPSRATVPARFGEVTP